MAVIGRHLSWVFLAFQIAIIESAREMFMSARIRALASIDLPCCCARSSATRFQIAVGVSDCQKVAVWVCSGVRIVLFALPSALTSLKSRAYRALVRGGGGPGRNWSGEGSANGVIVANCLNSGIGANTGGVGAQRPGVPAGAYVGGTVLMPSVARHAR